MKPNLLAALEFVVKLDDAVQVAMATKLRFERLINASVKSGIDIDEKVIIELQGEHDKARAALAKSITGH